MPAWRKLVVLRVVTGLAVAGGLAVACGGSGASHGGPPARARTTTIELGEYFYRPSDVTVKAGAPIRFLNVGKIEHTVADATPGGQIRSRLIHPRPLAHGASQTVVLRRPGTVPYVCTFHPQLMRGSITVTG